MSKFSIPKINIKFKLPMVLWVLFLLIVLVEAYVLFLGLNRGFGKSEGGSMGESKEVSKVDLPAYEETLEWVEDRENYNLSSYELESAEIGRENPFLE